jgi:hypothetical protein
MASEDSETGGEIPQKKLIIPVEALAYSNAVTLQAVVQLLSENGVLDWKEVLDRVEKFKEEPASMSPSRKEASPPEPGPAACGGSSL